MRARKSGSVKVSGHMKARRTTCRATVTRRNA